MKQIVTKGIILRRINYGEADRIVTFLTPDHGKVVLRAKGVRRVKSKLAGGIELFSVSSITFIEGKQGSAMGTLVSTRLDTYFGIIITDISRTMVGYEVLKQLHAATEDDPEAAYFTLLERSFAGLNDSTVAPKIVDYWFAAQLLAIGGSTPNMQTDTAGQPLRAGQQYQFDYTHMAFTADPYGPFSTDHIKLLRLSMASYPPQVVAHVTGVGELLPACSTLVATIPAHV